ncbi:threonine aldolase family protein [Dendrosporobacter sp. 1207_IL3150]|uniref:threonine aldolase family protein n=1 Tax=Dendrosporobacter sp. 1207_IL3150 TaxID=3084054 RepID=UPI002FDA1424
MYSFKNDYSEGAHPRILNALVESNFAQVEGYGKDIYTLKAADLLRQKLGHSDVDIHFFSGGTQANLTALSAFLRPHEAVIAANTGHVLVHETGAIEATGHKIISIEVSDGKLTSEHIKAAVEAHTDEHMVKPKLVYISNPTELGSIYTKDELKQLSYCCKDNRLILYVDGARLGSALCAKDNDLALSDLPNLVDAFYIGGTKNGALLGEAMIICCDTLKTEFRFHMKQKGALLAKGKLLGIQFLELFRDDLYFELANHANNMADILRREIDRLGCKFLIDSPSNQVFPILPNYVIARLQEKYDFYIWEKVDDDKSAIRLVTSWATNETAVLQLVGDLQKIMKS